MHGGDSRISRTRCSSPPAWGWHSHARTSSVARGPERSGVGRRDARRGPRAADRPGGVGFRPGRPCRLSEPDRGPAGSAGDRGGDRRPSAEGSGVGSAGVGRDRGNGESGTQRRHHRVRIPWGAGGRPGGARAGPLAGADHRRGASAAQSHGTPVPEPDGDPAAEPERYPAAEPVGRSPAICTSASASSDAERGARGVGLGTILHSARRSHGRCRDLRDPEDPGEVDEELSLHR